MKANCVLAWITHIPYYYMEESVLLGTKPLVNSIRHFIRDPSGVFSVCHLCECRIVQWRHDSRLLLLLNWSFASRLFSLHIIKRTLHVGSKIWILCSRGKNNISLVRHRVISSFYDTRHAVLTVELGLVDRYLHGARAHAWLLRHNPHWFLNAWLRW